MEQYKVKTKLRVKDGIEKQLPQKESENIKAAAEVYNRFVDCLIEAKPDTFEGEFYGKELPIFYKKFMAHFQTYLEFELLPENWAQETVRIIGETNGLS